jgi:hypothetical protein
VLLSSRSAIEPAIYSMPPQIRHIDLLHELEGLSTQ